VSGPLDRGPVRFVFDAPRIEAVILQRDPYGFTGASRGNRYYPQPASAELIQVANLYFIARYLDCFCVGHCVALSMYLEYHRSASM